MNVHTHAKWRYGNSKNPRKLRAHIAYSPSRRLPVLKQCHVLYTAHDLRQEKTPLKIELMSRD